jgi:hypothetical protein
MNIWLSVASGQGMIRKRSAQYVSGVSDRYQPGGANRDRLEDSYL